MQPKHRKSPISDYLKAGELEVALKRMAQSQIRLKSSDFDQIISFLEEELDQSLSNEQIRSGDLWHSEILRETQEEISDYMI